MAELKSNKGATRNRQLLFLFFSCLFMFIPVFISLFDYHGEIPRLKIPFTHIYLVHDKFVDNIRPEMPQTIAAVFLYSSLLIRGIVQIDFKTKKRLRLIFELIMVPLNILFIASFLKVFFKSNAISWLPKSISPISILIFGIIFSWLGLKSIAGYAWIFLFLISITGMTETSIAMGYTGTIYILSAFLSIIFQFLPENRFSDLIQAFKSDFKVAKKEINEDLHNAKESTEKIVKTTTTIAASANGISLPKAKKGKQ